jgi:hypothetical protein
VNGNGTGNVGDDDVVAVGDDDVDVGVVIDGVYGVGVVDVGGAGGVGVVVWVVDVVDGGLVVTYEVDGTNQHVCNEIAWD